MLQYLDGKIIEKSERIKSMQVRSYLLVDLIDSTVDLI